MKIRKKNLLLLVLCFILAGCSEKKGGLNDGTDSVEQLSEKQVNVSDIPTKESTVSPSDKVDYDLTVMGSEMVYAMVYQLMTNPDEYADKTIKIEGSYYPTYYEPAEKYYHYVVIKDATACCAQGIEFVWDDGNHQYPEEYPKEEEEVIVTGKFETYQEDGDKNLYFRLKDASLDIVSTR